MTKSWPEVQEQKCIVQFPSHAFTGKSHDFYSFFLLKNADLGEEGRGHT